MTPALAEDLLARLTAGDAEAASRVFLAYEPYLRSVIRRQIPPGVRSKFDSRDVVQSAWGDIVEKLRDSSWRFDSPGQLQAFLTKLVRNRCVDRLRQVRRSVEREHPLKADDSRAHPACGRPSPGDLAEASDLWERLLALCPPEHHELLRLKRDGVPAHEIAARTGLHEGSVRRVLRQLAARLASGGGHA